MCVCEWDKRKTRYCLVSSRARVSDSAKLWVFSRNLFIGPTSSLECVYLALIHTSFVHVCLWTLCRNANLNKPPCPLFCANTNVYQLIYCRLSLKLTFQRSDISNVNIGLFSPRARAAPFIPRPFILPSWSSHLFSLCSPFTPWVCFLWSPVEVKKVNMSFSTITLPIVLFFALFWLFPFLSLLFFPLLFCNSSLSQPNYVPFF